MINNYYNAIKQLVVRGVFVLCIVGCLRAFTSKVYAKEDSIAVNGKVFEFPEGTNYEFSIAEESDNDAFGTFAISGDLKSIDNKDGVSAYVVSSENIIFNYSYNQSQLNIEETEWHLMEDKAKKIDEISLGENVSRGAIIVQSSMDGNNWITDVAMTDVFAADSNSLDAFYITKEIQLENGCYYRVIVAYGLQRVTGEKQILFFPTKETDKKRIIEIYEFYAISSEIDGNTANAADKPRKELGGKVKTELDEGYSGSSEIGKDDPHYGWNLGTFVVNGYTRETVSNDIPIFLKNVGDKVTLWFTLAQDINKLNGKSELTISEDSNGYDQNFEISQTNFKHGALIIRYTDYEGKIHEPVIYTDFLAANAMAGADTRVQLFEEGDYEISLDYEIKNNPRQIGPVSVIPTYTNYKITFNFSIRNGNCMIYPFDNETGAELPDGSITPNGFRLDMAKSRYLMIDVTRTILNMGVDGRLTEDVRFNRPAKDNEAYTDEGIYTFTVRNQYTSETTTKTIYVGTDKYLMALSRNALTVSALNEKIEQNAIIGDDGTIIDYVPPEELEPEQELSELDSSKEQETKPIIVAEALVNEVLSESPSAEDLESETTKTFKNSFLILCIVVVIVGGVFIAVTITKKSRRNKGETDV